jgi:mono/diheme cytochrome c family protein
MSYGCNGDTARKLLVASALILLASPLHAQNPTPPNSSQWGSGKNLYDKVCAHCHAPEVGVGTAIQGRGLPEPYIKYIVRHGFNAMPAFPASYIDDQSIALVTEYIASLPAAPAKP